jgi:hypothetical protein
MLVNKWIWLVVAVISFLAFSYASILGMQLESGIYGGLGLATITVFILSLFEVKESKHSKLISAVREMYDLGLYTSDEYGKLSQEIDKIFKVKEGKENDNMLIFPNNPSKKLFRLKDDYWELYKELFSNDSIVENRQC